MQKRKRKSNDDEKDGKEMVRKMLSEMVGYHRIIENNKGKKNQTICEWFRILWFEIENFEIQQKKFGCFLIKMTQSIKEK